MDMKKEKIAKHAHAITEHRLKIVRRLLRVHPPHVLLCVLTFIIICIHSKRFLLPSFFFF
jgi:hypothetical protein